MPITACCRVDDEMIGRGMPHLVGSILEVQFLMAPNQVRQKFANGEVRRRRGLVRPTFASGSNVKQVFEKNLRRPSTAIAMA